MKRIRKFWVRMSIFFTDFPEVEMYRASGDKKCELCELVSATFLKSNLQRRPRQTMITARYCLECGLSFRHGEPHSCVPVTQGGTISLDEYLASGSACRPHRRVDLNILFRGFSEVADPEVLP